MYVEDQAGQHMLKLLPGLCQVRFATQRSKYSAV